MRIVKEELGDYGKDYGTTISGTILKVGSSFHILPSFTQLCTLFKNPYDSLDIDVILTNTDIDFDILDGWRESELIDIVGSKIEFTNYGLKYYKKNREFQKEIKENVEKIKFGYGLDG